MTTKEKGWDKNVKKRLIRTKQTRGGCGMDGVVQVGLPWQLYPASSMSENPLPDAMCQKRLFQGHGNFGGGDSSDGAAAGFWKMYDMIPGTCV